MRLLLRPVPRPRERHPLTTKTKTKWWARFAGVRCMGPFDSHIAAVKAVTDTKGYPMPDAYVWPVETVHNDE